MTDFELQDFLPYLLNRAAEKASLDFQAVYKREYGMLRTEWRVLFHLGAYGEMTAKEICESGGLHKTKVSRAVSALEEKRLLKRIRSESDRREEYLSLTQPGTVAFRNLKARAREYQENFTSQFSSTEFGILTNCLQKLAEKR
ncbi:MAG: MarR family transcriptional regulator [Pseudomonadota bacterium]